MIDGECQHYNWPFTGQMLLGSFFIALNSSMATLAGAGGGTIAFLMLITMFEYMQKDARVVMITCVFGASIGNICNLITKSYNNRPLIQYRFSFVIIPLLSMG